MLVLELDWAEVADSGVAAAGVVEAFDPLEDRCPELGLRLPVVPVEELA